MSSQVEIVEIKGSYIAAVTRRLMPAEFPRAIPEMLEEVWEFLSGRGIESRGHNVVVYRSHNSQGMHVEAGVQVAAEFTPEAGIACSLTPSGKAAHYVHVGPYHELGKAHDALAQFCTARDFASGVHWEVYGDWTEDPTKLRTDVYRTIPG
jgi:effector-binding domain-containing protein